jgi:hypothetical protein
MVSKKIILFVILALILNSCREFKREKIEVNYREGYIKVLSEDYVIDSLRVYNHINQYYVIGLLDKKGGTNIIHFKKTNVGYKIYADSLDYYCSQIPDVNSPGLEVVIRKKGFSGNENGKEYVEIQYSGYNQIPCNSTLIDTIETESPYK